MFYKTIDSITPNERRALAGLGVEPARISEWKAKKRLPTRAQTVALATVKRVDFNKLEREIVLLELEHESKKNSGYAEVLSQIKKLWRMERAMGIEPTS